MPTHAWLQLHSAHASLAFIWPHSCGLPMHLTSADEHPPTHVGPKHNHSQASYNWRRAVHHYCIVCKPAWLVSVRPVGGLLECVSAVQNGLFCVGGLKLCGSIGPEAAETGTALYHSDILRASRL